MYNYLLEHDYLFRVRYVIPVHDEINLECEEGLVDEITEVLIKCMREAGTQFCPLIPLDVDVSVGDFWIH